MHRYEQFTTVPLFGSMEHLSMVIVVYIKPCRVPLYRHTSVHNFDGSRAKVPYGMK